MIGFPRYVFRPGEHGRYESFLVSNEEEYESGLGNGWFSTIDECLNQKVEEAETEKSTSFPSRQELESMGKELGIKFDGRTSDAKLAKLVEEELKS